MCAVSSTDGPGCSRVDAVHILQQHDAVIADGCPQCFGVLIREERKDVPTQRTMADHAPHGELSERATNGSTKKNEVVLKVHLYKASPWLYV